MRGKGEEALRLDGNRRSQGLSEVLEEEGQAKCNQDGVFGGPFNLSAAHGSEEDALEDVADGESHDAAGQDGDKGGDAGKPSGGHEVGNHAADHVELAMCEADDAQDREDERQTQSHQAVNDADNDPVGKLGDDEAAIGDAQIVGIGQSKRGDKNADDERDGDADHAVVDFGRDDPERDEAEWTERGADHGTAEGCLGDFQVFARINARRNYAPQRTPE